MSCRDKTERQVPTLFAMDKITQTTRYRQAIICYANQHTDEEIKLIYNMRRRNPNSGIVVFWLKLRQRGYTRSISGLYRFLRKCNAMAEKLPNP